MPFTGKRQAYALKLNAKKNTTIETARTDRKGWEDAFMCRVYSSFTSPVNGGPHTPKVLFDGEAYARQDKNHFFGYEIEIGF